MPSRTDRLSVDCAVLGDDAFPTAWAAEGQAMTLEEAVPVALEEDAER